MKLKLQNSLEYRMPGEMQGQEKEAGDKLLLATWGTSSFCCIEGLESSLLSV